MPTPTVNFRVMGNPPPRISSGERGPQVVVNYLIKWADSLTFYNDVLGFGVAAGAEGPTIYTPAYHYPIDPSLLALSCEIEPINVIEGFPAAGTNQGLGPTEFFNDARAVVTFGVPSYSSEGDAADVNNFHQFDPDNPITYCVCNTRMASHMEDLPTGGTKWSSDGKKLNFPMQRRTIDAELTLTFPRVAYLPWRRLRTFIGKINTYPVLNCPAKTLIFNGIEGTVEAFVDGTRKRAITLSFTYRSREWDKEYRDGNLAEVIVYTDGSALYESVDLRLMFLL
jgi:hypothetical protein